MPYAEHVYIQRMGMSDIKYSRIKTKCLQLIVYDTRSDMVDLLDFENARYIKVYSLDKTSYVEINHNSLKELILIKGVNYDVWWLAHFINANYLAKIEIIWESCHITQRTLTFLKQIKNFKISNCFYYGKNNNRILIDYFDSNAKDCDTIISNLYAKTI
jgi:hypothetical protein